MSNRIELGQRLKDFRKSIGLNQSYVANALGINRTSIGHYETGRTEPTSTYICWLHERGLNINWLYSGAGEMRRDNLKDLSRIENKDLEELLAPLLSRVCQETSIASPLILAPSVQILMLKVILADMERKAAA